jgi:alkylated DNA repair protein (DNA oxidative demethylase)
MISVQASLFDPPPLPGLSYRPDFVSVAEEQALAEHLVALDLAPFQFHGWLGRRKVVSFGWRYDFNDARFTPAAPIPDFLLPLRERAATLAELTADELAHVLVTRYDPGAGIGWHRDRPLFERVVGISLLAPCTLRFRRRSAAGFERFSLPAAPRSAYALAGEARHQWEHSIATMAALRWSITFRSLSDHGRKAAGL